jgi:hypothetical protein
VASTRRVAPIGHGGTTWAPGRRGSPETRPRTVTTALSPGRTTRKEVEIHVSAAMHPAAIPAVDATSLQGTRGQSDRRRARVSPNPARASSHAWRKLPRFTLAATSPTKTSAARISSQVRTALVPLAPGVRRAAAPREITASNASPARMATAKMEPR